MIVKYFAEKGLRRHNEDYVLSRRIDKNIYFHIVADGMGEYTKGSVASKIVSYWLFRSNGASLFGQTVPL